MKSVYKLVKECPGSPKLMRYKNPLFTTEDGVDIFEGDSYTVVSLIDIEESTVYTEVIMKPYEIWNNCKLYELIKGGSNNFLAFSTKEAAEEYILMSKPCLSIQDILSKTEYPGYWCKTLKELVKSKL